MLGPENRGHLAILALVPSIVCQLGLLGADNAITYYIARDFRATAYIIRTMMVLALVQIVLCGTLNAFVVWLLTRDESHGVQSAAWVTLIVPPAMLLRSYGLAVLQGLRRFGPFNALRLVQPVLYAGTLLLLLIVDLFVSDVISLTVIAAIWSATTVAATVTVLIVARTIPPPEPGAAVLPRGDLLRFGAKGFLGAVSPLETFRLDQAVVGLFLSPAALGVYVASLAFTNLPRFIAQSIGLVAFPHIAGQPDDQLARRSMWRFFWLTLGSSVAVGLALGAAAPRLVPLVFGDDFRDAVVPMQILLAGSVVFGARRVLGEGLRGRGYPAANTIAEIASWIWLLPAFALFVPRLELNGVAIALVTASVVSLAALLRLAFSPNPGRQIGLRSYERRLGDIRQSFNGLTGRTRKNGFLATVAVLSIAIAAGAITSAISPSIVDFLLLALGAILIVPLLKRAFARRFDPFEPLVIYTAAYGVMFLVRSTAMVVNNDFLYVWPTRTFDVRSGFAEMLLLAVVGAVGFLAGYALPLGCVLAQRMKPPPKGYHIDTVVIGAIGLAVTGSLLFGLHLHQIGRLGSLGLILSGRDPEVSRELLTGGIGYLSMGRYLLTPASLIFIAVGRAHRNLPLKLLAATSIAILILSAVPTGSRTTLLPFVGGLIVYHYASRFSRPRPGVVLAFGALALLASALLADTRTDTSRQEYGGVDEIVVQTLKNPSRVLSRLTEGGDTAMAPGLAAVMPLIPEEFPYQYGRAVFGDLVTRPIPRVLWHEKPLAPREEVIRAILPREYAAGIARPEFSILLYFYLDWGIAGVALGMAVLGTLARMLYEYFRRHESNLVVQLLFGTSLMFLVGGMRDSPVDTLIRMSFTVFPIWLVFEIAAIRFRPAIQQWSHAS